jgi:hypothetical protein
MRLMLIPSLLMVAVASVAVAQTPPPAGKVTPQGAPKDAPKASKAKPPESSARAKFFQSDSVITVTLTTNVGKLRGDKNAETAPWRPATFTYVGPDTAHGVIPVRVKTRGIWRLKNCQFPPVRLNFAGDAVKHTVFHGLDKPKLVNHCRDDDAYEQYVLQEFQLYRVYNLLTPLSHAVRLLRMTYADSANGKVLATRYAFIEEEPGVLAERNASKQVKLKGARPDDLEPYQSALVGVFQFLIGNTDFAFGALHNVELLQRNDTGEYLAVVYDFDFSGAVNARYATPDPRLHISSVRDRIYRGFCVPEEQYPKVFALFNAKKDSIYALYHDPIGKLLRPNVVDETLRYFDEFYKTINNPRSVKNEIIDACVGHK